MKKGLKIGAASLAALMVFGVAGCSVKDKDGKAWAEKNGYVKASDYNIIKNDADTSATNTGVGGINFGDLDWSENLKKETLREYLKGHKYADGTYNYREMYQIATSVNNVPQVSSVEYYMNPETFNFFGFSENNTGKLNDMMTNNNVAMYWTRQLRDEELSAFDYYKSYGVEIQGKVVIHTVEEVATLTDAEITALAKDVRAYYKSLGTTKQYWDTTNANYISNDKTLLETAFASKMGKGYSIVPTKIVITSPYLIYLTKTGEEFKYGEATYPFLDATFLNKLLTYVHENGTYEGHETAVHFNEYWYSAVAYQVCMGAAGNDQAAQAACPAMKNVGLKTQATLTFNN